MEDQKSEEDRTREIALEALKWLTACAVCLLALWVILWTQSPGWLANGSFEPVDVFTYLLTAGSFISTIQVLRKVWSIRHKLIDFL